MDEVESTVATVGELVEHLERRRTQVRRHSRRVLHPDHEDERDLPLLLRLASARLDRRLEDRLGTAEHRLTLLDVEVLQRVRSRPSGGVHVAEHLGRSPQRVSAVLRRLREAGLVERDASWKDQRVSETRLTDDGFDALEAAEARLDPVLGWELDGLGHDGRRALALLLAILASG